MIHSPTKMSLDSFLKALITLLFLSLILSSCGEEPRPERNLSKSPLIPKPNSVKETGSSFLIKPTMSINFLQGDADVEQIAEQLAKEWNKYTGQKLVLGGDAKGGGVILASLPQKDGAEGYTLQIEEDEIKIMASNPVGFYRGWQSLKQLILIEDAKGIGKIYIPTGVINDNPNYEYRGTMLDVSRHFFTLDEVKEHIDMISLYKFNYLHLHLSDDQGWRIEIKSWPKLATYGGSTEVGGGEGGYYTQEDYKEIVKYAADRFITIVPEIDIPGHTNAALASYPELNCDGKKRELYTGIEVGFSTLCVKKELTYKFLNDVVGEIAAMTPGPYFHMGGDESHVTPKDEYLIFINRAVEIIKKHGKTPMGWDEFTAGDIPANSVGQHWNSPENAIRGQDKGGKVVMSPAKRAYLDMQYDSTSTYGLHWAAYIEVQDGYEWNPETYIPGLKKENILGVEAPLWSETVSNLDEAEYLLYPRLLGYSEIGWSPAKDRSWDDYSQRLAQHAGYLQKLGVDFYVSPQIEWETTPVTK